MPPRRPGEVLPLERDVLVVAAELAGRSGDDDGWFWAFGLAKVLADRYEKRSLIAHGTLYKTLHSMADEDRRWLETRLESDEEAAKHAGPARRYYRLGPNGGAALARAEARPRVPVRRGVLAAEFIMGLPSG